MMKFLLLLPVQLSKALIRFYQKTISLDHGVLKSLYPYGYCKFYPTCSEYAVQALEKKGMIKGSFFIFRRLLRCHPWSQGGVDQIS